jgi:FAD/FMN-containing dehydrogenase
MTAPVPADVLSKLKAVLGPTGWSEDPVKLDAKLLEWRGRWRGETPLLVLPRDVEQVSAVVAICAGHGVAITPQGGNTGLVGGQIPYGEILLSTERLNRVREVAPEDGAMVLEAGVTLWDAQQAAAEADRFFPLSLAAEGTATIGGNISTNAGGTAVLRYGVMRDQVLGLEAVMPDGRVFHGLKRLRKDNTGYDLKDLFIGAEGTLGIITAAVLKLLPRPTVKVTAFCGLASTEAGIALFSRIRAAAGNTLTTFELMPRLAINMVLRHVPTTRDPLAQRHAWYVLLELSGQVGRSIEELGEELIGGALTAGEIEDAALATSIEQANDFWRIRESITEAQRSEGASLKHDVSVPISSVPRFLIEADAAVEQLIPGAVTLGFGHVGDGNVHYNVFQPTGSDGRAFLSRCHEIGDAIYEVVERFNGSFSAEHGIGQLKRDVLARVKDPIALEVMRGLKRLLDPQGLLNPGKVL